jgi:hypothetical protein
MVDDVVLGDQQADVQQRVRDLVDDRRARRERVDRLDVERLLLGRAVDR